MNFPSELGRHRSDKFTEVARLVPSEQVAEALQRPDPPTDSWRRAADALRSVKAAQILRERGSAPKGVGALRYLIILGENYACQVPICAVAA